MVTIRNDKSLSNCAMYKDRFMENTKKLDTSAGKCDYQLQFKAIIEASMVYTTERFTDNSTISPGPPIIFKKRSARK